MYTDEEIHDEYEDATRRQPDTSVSHPTLDDYDGENKEPNENEA
jgi:hypothetical protein